MQRMYFIGVDTSGSQIRHLFPRWARMLGIDAELVGLDIPLDAEPGAFRRAVEELRRDPRGRGALVTTHKVSVYRHAGASFNELDEWSELCGEVSCITKRGDRLHGWAKDPITSWQAFVDIGGADYFSRYPAAAVACLGAGGSGTAFSARLLQVDRPPARMVVSNRSAGRLETLRQVHARLAPDVPVEYRAVGSAEDSDAIVSSLPAHSLVVNATGLGKDRPGSPISNAARFPRAGIAWEFNYRGQLEFLAQARRQAREQDLRVEDGWRYFLYGWTSHIAEIFELDLDRQRFDALAAAAEPLRAGGG